MNTLAILGRETKLCQAELSSLYPHVQHFGPVSVIDSPQQPSIGRLGGTTKLAAVITNLPTNTSPANLVDAIFHYLVQTAGDGKLHFGLSVYSQGHSRSTRAEVHKLGLEIKKALRAHGKSVRFVEGKSGNELGAAQLKYNQLTTKGFEIIVVHTLNGILLARTYAYQDIDSYSKRDWDRPVRDSKVGMLPPKLAQIMINLANPAKDSTVYDPFCGNGVILQEALLMGFNVLGSDLSDAMVRASTQNTNWLRDHYDITGTSRVWAADATKLTELPDNSVIVTEGYLGTPIHGPLRASQQNSVIDPVNTLYTQLLSNLRPLLAPGARLVISFPCWSTPDGLLHLPVIDQIADLGYTTHQCSGSSTLVYRRDNQFVGREIAVLIAS